MEALPRLGVLYTEGNQLPSLTGTLTDESFEGATVTLKIRRPGDVLTKTATVTGGVFTIAWDNDDLEAGLGQEALLTISVGGLSQTLLRFSLDVDEDIQE